MMSLFTVLTLLAVLSNGLCEQKQFLQRTGMAFSGSLLAADLGSNPHSAFALLLTCISSLRHRQQLGHGAAGSGPLEALQGSSHSSNLWGKWTQPQYCPSGFITTFQLRVEPAQGSDGDDTAANNIRFRCSSYNTILEGSGMSWGAYGSWSETCSEGGICGIETKIERRQGRGDDTALNDVRFHCCVRTQQTFSE
ncbi:vitelline membrane outer layer protein 1-like [Pholidichthys leucotaenia]